MQEMPYVFTAWVAASIQLCLESQETACGPSRVSHLAGRGGYNPLYADTEAKNPWSDLVTGLLVK